MQVIQSIVILPFYNSLRVIKSKVACVKAIRDEQNNQFMDVDMISEEPQYLSGVDLAFPSGSPASDEDLFNHKQGSVAHSLSLSPTQRPDMTEYC